MPSLPSATSNHRVIASAIGQEFRVRYEPPNGLSSELRRLLGQIPCSDTVRKQHRSHDLWLTNDEARRLAEISVRFLTREGAFLTSAGRPRPRPLSFCFNISDG